MSNDTCQLCIKENEFDALKKADITILEKIATLTKDVDALKSRLTVFATGGAFFGSALMKAIELMGQ